MDASNIISLIALVVAIITGIANYWYTKRTFQASYYPAIQASLDFSRSLEGLQTIGARVENLSSDVSAPVVKASIYIAGPLRGWLFWRKKWLLYREYDESIAPNGEMMSELTPTQLYSIRGGAQPINNFLLEKFPDYIRRVTYPIHMRRNPDYEIPKPRPLHLLLKVVYQSNKSGTGIRKIAKTYRLMPQLDPNKKLRSWELSIT